MAITLVENCGLVISEMAIYDSYPIETVRPILASEVAVKYL
jgi:hypothetical protein